MTTTTAHRSKRRRYTRHDCWRDMRDAPRDGNSILCFTERGDYEIAHWDAVVDCWISKRGFLVTAIRWTQLPHPPLDVTAEGL